MANTPQNGGNRRPPIRQSDPYAQRRKPPQSSRDIYSRSAGTQKGNDPMVDLNSYTNAPHKRPPLPGTRPTVPKQRPTAQHRRRAVPQPEAHVRYHDGFDPDDIATAVGRRRAVEPGPAREMQGTRRHHPWLILLCIVLALLLAVFGWLTLMFSHMDRTHNTVPQSTYACTPQYAPTWPLKSSPWVTNILLIGMDQDADGSRRSDTLILLSVDRLHMKLKMTSFLRDTYAEIPNHGRQKLNSAFAYGGPAMTMQTLENNFRIKIDQYMAVNFDSFSTIINEVGGIDVTLDKGLCDQFNENLHTSFSPGKYTLKGQQAVYYTRIRNYGNDYGRTQRQREVTGQLMKKMAAAGPIKLTGILNKFLPQTWTNIPAPELAGICMLNFPAVAFPQKTQQIPADNTFTGKTFDDAGWVEVTDFAKNDMLLRQFIYEDSSTD